MKCHSSKPWSAVPDSAGSARPMRDCFTECFSSSDSDDANTCDSNVTKDVPTNKQAENELDDRSKRNLPDKSMCEKQELMSYWFPFKCDICDIKFTGEKPYLQHLEGKTHAKNIQQQNIGEGNGTSTRSPYKFHCNICDAYFCTERDRQAHNEGKKHLERAVKANRVPERPHPCIKKNECCDGFNLVEYSPRGYQVELYKQAMLNDTVCFLPTGMLLAFYLFWHQGLHGNNCFPQNLLSRHCLTHRQPQGANIYLAEESVQNGCVLKLDLEI